MRVFSLIFLSFFPMIIVALLMLSSIDLVGGLGFFLR